MNNKLLLIVTLACFSCTGKVIRNDASIRFMEQKHDFGKISLKKGAVYSFEFSNSGKSFLVIYDVKTSCGCTVPEWVKEPLRPGGKRELKIKYDASYPGVFHKTIEVYYNGTDSPAKLEIEGEVGEN
jgi:hypothetical protein